MIDPRTPDTHRPPDSRSFRIGKAVPWESSPSLERFSPAAAASSADRPEAGETMARSYPDTIPAPGATPHSPTSFVTTVGIDTPYTCSGTSWRPAGCGIGNDSTFAAAATRTSTSTTRFTGRSRPTSATCASGNFVPSKNTATSWQPPRRSIIPSPSSPYSLHEDQYRGGDEYGCDDELISLCPPAEVHAADNRLHVLQLSASRSSSALSGAASPFPYTKRSTPTGRPTSRSRRATSLSLSSSSPAPVPPQFLWGTPRNTNTKKKNKVACGRNLSSGTATATAAPALTPGCSRGPTPAAPISTKYKTELCETYGTTGACSFGRRCNFAHGPGELRKNKVSDLQAAGVTDAENHRVKPCFTFVSTGSCPFGIRCKFLHDPRVANSADGQQQYQTWLDHYDHPVQNVESDLVVDNLHNYFTNGVHHNNPFGSALAPAISSLAAENASYRNENGAPSAYYDLSRNYFYKEELWGEFYSAVATGVDLNTLMLPEEYQGRKEEKEMAMGVPHITSTASNGIGPSSPSRTSISSININSPTKVLRGLTHLNTPSPTSVATTSFGPAVTMSYHQGPKLSEKQRIKIALKMCYYPSTERYTYAPRSTIFGSTAMVVQSRAFAISEEGEIEPFDNKSPTEMAGGNKPNVVYVVEIAFGSDNDPKAKVSTALYFDLPRQCIQTRKSNPSASPPLALMTMDTYLGSASNQPFYLTRPYDDGAIALTLSILEHRLEVIDLPTLEVEQDALDIFADSSKIEKVRAHISSVEMTELGLRSRFQSLLRHWGHAFWDRCAERFDPTDVEATVLHVNGNYNPSLDHHKGTGVTRSVRHWNSFLITMSRGCFSSNAHRTSDMECDCPVHINRSFADDHDDKDDEEQSAQSVYAAKDRCWRDLLLINDYEEGEWESARRIMDFQKEQKRMSRPSSRAATMTRPSSRATSVASNTSYYGGKGFGRPDAHMRSLTNSGTPSPLPTPVSFSVVSNVEGW